MRMKPFKSNRDFKKILTQNNKILVCFSALKKRAMIERNKHRNIGNGKADKPNPPQKKPAKNLNAENAKMYKLSFKKLHLAPAE